MDTLFDVSPDEPVKKRSARGPKPLAKVEEPISIKEVLPTRALRPIEKLDDVVECIDPACGTSCADIILDEGREWLIQCCFCTKMQWIPQIPGHLPPAAKEDEFVFRDGRFAGMTIGQAVLEPRGRQYVEWAATQHKRDAVKAACKSWLDQKNAPA